MMKRILVIGVLIGYWAVLLAPFLTYVGFILNKEKIVAELCEQRDVPASSCHGSCYLEKQLSAGVVQTQEPADRSHNEFVTHVLSPHCISHWNAQLFASGVTAVFEQFSTVLKSADVNGPLFDPPDLLV